MEPNGSWKGWRAMAVVSAMAGQLAASVLLGYWAGTWADRAWGTHPWLLVVGLLGGLAVGIYGIVRILRPYLGGDE
ncbi:hypothetical protein JCM14720_09520 [Calditerricola yamamurae]|jgi:Uncharacterized protein conserved in bacteria|nr:hypothetical protein [Bacillota bacterium]